MSGKILLAMSVTLLMLAFGGSAKAGTIRYCNLAPYDVELVFLEKSRADYSINSTETLPSGACDSLRFTQPQGSQLYYYLRGSNTRSLRKLRQNIDFVEAWGGWPLWWDASYDDAICINIENGDFFGAPVHDQCDGAAKILGANKIKPDGNGEFSIWNVDSIICGFDIDADCEEEPAPLLNWAHMLNKSLDASARSFEIERYDRYYGVIPTALGWEVSDHNGAYRKGALVTFAYDKTTLGSLIHVRSGDVVLEFNDQPVFDRNDLVYYTILHGLNGGYEEPYRVLVERNGENILFEGFQVFNRNSYGGYFLGSDGLCGNPAAASITGALREASFYTNHILGCMNFDKDSQPERNRKCEFTVKQVAAAYRQFCPDQTFYATMIGGIFMPGRQVPESLLSRYLFKGIRAPARIMRAIALEGAEEAARTALTLPPGFSAATSLKEIRQQAEIGAAIGTGFTLLLPHGFATRR